MPRVHAIGRHSGLDLVSIKASALLGRRKRQTLVAHHVFQDPSDPLAKTTLDWSITLVRHGGMKAF